MRRDCLWGSALEIVDVPLDVRCNAQDRVCCETELTATD